MSEFFYTSVDRHKNKLFFRGYKDGSRIMRKIDYVPTLYVPSKVPTEFKTLKNTYVSPIQPGTMYDCSQFIKNYEEVDGFEISGTTNYVHQFISDVFLDGITWSTDRVNVTSIDIEVKSDEGFPVPDLAQWPITAITIVSSIEKVYYVWGLKDFDPSQTQNKNLKIVYKKCKDEVTLLRHFINHWIKNCPDVITGWNSRLFDMVYLINRIKSQVGYEPATRISPWGIIEKDKIFIAGREHETYSIVGIQQLDYFDLFKKFGYTYGNQESYKLDHIASEVLGEKKIDYSEYASLNQLYKENHQKFIDYNIRDTALIERFEEKMGLISLCLTIAYKGLVNYSEAFGPVNLWDALIFNELRKKNVVVPPKISHKKDEKIEGAFVKEPKKGRHNYVVSFDVKSLYPSLIMQYNMSPETICDQFVPDVSIEKLLNKELIEIPKNRTMAASGQLFRSDIKGFFPKLISELFEERALSKKEENRLSRELNKINIELSKKKVNDAVDELITKKKELENNIVIYNNRQMAIKILMNSLYGALSNKFFRYYDDRIAEGITLSGQFTIRWAEKEINKFLNEHFFTENIDYVIAIDTDSLYISFEKYVDLFVESKDIKNIIEYIDRFCKEKIQVFFNKSFEDLKVYVQSPVQKISMNREVIADNGIWTGKKRYILNVWDQEGTIYNSPKLKITGIECVRSSTPKICRTMIKDTIAIIMNGSEDDMQKEVEKNKSIFFSQRPENISFPRGISDLDKFSEPSTLYRKGTPIHCRGALLHNDLVQKYNLKNKYEIINNGNKIKFCYLKMPNPIKENIIAFTNILPPEFNLDQYIDFELQFQKSYIEPIKRIMETIGWEPEKRSNLDSFFL